MGTVHIGTSGTVDRGSCATRPVWFLTRRLGALSRVSGAADRAIAVRLAALSAGRGHLKLGYSRIADYTRERLDLSERNAFDLCRLGRALGQLPRLDKALT